MTPSDRDKLGEQLSAYLDGELSPSEEVEVEGLLAEDAEARELLDDLRAAIGSIQGMPRETAPRSILDDVTAQLEREQLLGTPDEGVVLARQTRRPMTLTLAMAAVVVMAVGAALWVSMALNRRPRQSIDTVAVNPRDAFEKALRSPQASEETSANRSSSMKSETEDGAAGQDVFEAKAKKPQSLQDLIAGAREPEAMPTEVAEELRAEDKGVPASRASQPKREVAEADLERERSFAQSNGKSRFNAVATDNAEKLTETAPSTVSGQEDIQTKKKEFALFTADAEEEIPLDAGEAGNLDKENADFDFGDVAAVTEAEEPGLTLERKIDNGIDAMGIERHQFDNEPLQLVAEFAGQGDQELFCSNLQEFLTANGVEDVGELAVEPGAGGSDISSNTQLYFMGQSSTNFVSDCDEDRRYLVRLSGDVFAELVGRVLPRADGLERAQLRFGGLTASGWCEVNKLAALTLGDSPAVRSLTMDSYAAARNAGDNAAPGASEFEDVVTWLSYMGLLPQDKKDERPSGDVGKDRRTIDSLAALGYAGGTAGTNGVVASAAAIGDRKNTEPVLTLVVKLVPSSIHETDSSTDPDGTHSASFPTSTNGL